MYWGTPRMSVPVHVAWILRRAQSLISLANMLISPEFSEERERIYDLLKRRLREVEDEYNALRKSLSKDKAELIEAAIDLARRVLEEPNPDMLVDDIKALEWRFRVVRLTPVS